MIGADEEATTPKVRPSMPHSLDEADELTLVSRQFVVVGSEWSNKEGQGALPLVKDSAEAYTQRVIVDDELPVKVRHLQDRS
jgi:hypothetical protein